MRSLARYGVANAVTRAMLSELLTEEEFLVIARAGSVDGAWSALGKTAYGEWLPGVPPLEPLAVERVLRETTAARFRRSTRALTGKPADVASILLSRWELDDVELALRLWHGKDPYLNEVVSAPLTVQGITLEKLAEAENIEQAALVFRNTPYLDPIYSAAKDYREKGAIFYVEVALERDYYRRLLDATKALGGADAVQGTRIVSAEIDLLNLSWCTRLLEYYGVEPAAVHAFMVPGASEVFKQLARPGLTREDLAALTSGVVGAWREGESGQLSAIERGSLLESLVSEMAVATARSVLAGYPFSISCVFSFYLLKRVELRNLITVLSGKAAGLGEDVLRGKLLGLRG